MTISALEGIGALVGMAWSASEPGSAVLFGFSPVRIILFGGAAILVSILGGLAWGAFKRPAWFHKWVRIADWLTRSPVSVFAVFFSCYVFFCSILAVLLLSISPAASEITLLKTLLNRAGPLLVWAALLALQLGCLILWDLGTRARFLQFASTPFRAGLLLVAATGIYTIALRFFLAVTWDLRFRGLEIYIFLPAILLLGWGFAHPFLLKKPGYAAASQGFLLLFIGLAVYTVYWHTAQMFRYESTQDAAIWHLLARSFLEGKLYLENPSSFHDLTPYGGHWYVPSPPLPALILTPLIALIGFDRLNMVQFAVFCGAANAMVAFAVLSAASRRGLIPTNTPGNLWLTALLAFGTTHWWLSVVGTFVYLSQLLTLFFAGLAVLLAIKKASPWLIGLCLGIGILSRPNIFTLWPLLAGITLFLEQQAGRIQWKQIILWAVKTGPPVAFCAGILLLYNFLRFHNFMDFGYVTVNSAAWIMDAVRTYGMFNLHFLPINFQMMFLKMPFVGLVNGRFYYSPGYEGTSILAMTPAVLYLFRRFRMSWWTISAWTSTILTAGLLLLYSNTGSWQIGYRYAMDFILPVLLLLAAGAGERTSRGFAALATLSILINGANVAWWFTHM